MRCLSAGSLLTIILSTALVGESADWSASQINKLPSSETPVRLFNGKDFAGWQGQIGKYWSIAVDTVVGRNTA